jgi:hypothetical protein
MSLITNIPNCSWKSEETGQTTNSQLASCFAELKMAASGQSEVTAYEPEIFQLGGFRAAQYDWETVRSSVPDPGLARYRDSFL